MDIPLSEQREGSVEGQVTRPATPTSEGSVGTPFARPATPTHVEARDISPGGRYVRLETRLGTGAYKEV
jgi:hypothetical protein